MKTSLKIEYKNVIFDVEKVACDRVIISAGILLRWHHMTLEVPGSVCGCG